MRSGNYIRALGRQSFEPSQPSPASDEALTTSEESQAMQRELIKAQNDVLATVGVCLRETRQNLDQSSAIMAENEVGLLVGAVDLTVTYLSSWPFIALRNRLQTYRLYEGMRYRDVLKLTWGKLTVAKAFAGMPAHLCYQLVNLTRDYLQARFIVWLHKKSFFKDPRTRQPRRKWLLTCINKCLSASAWVVVYPLFYHSFLQTLQLLPASPVLPPPTSFIPFSSTSPLRFPDISGTSLLGTARHLVSQAGASYFVWSFINQTTCVSLQFFLFKRILRILPRPDYPERRRISAEEDMSLSHWDDVPAPAEEPGVAAIMIEEVGHRSGGTTSFTATVRIDPESGEAVPASRAEDQDPLEIESSAAQPEPRASTPPPPLQEEEEVAEIGPHSSPRLRQQYRHTTLSSHPVDVVASHAADGLANAVTFGFESAAMRILARTCLSRRGVHPLVINHAIYPPGDPMANWKLVAKALVVGEWGLMWGLFEMTYFVSSFIGVRWFGYWRYV